ncbi:hypothetical protein ABTX15_05675 [Micromonospora sp. NPDC094482]|uniref:CdiA C-terminal domain-containing protein n=1 Tax=unclassified Micromonospora TaxID=2617518 RepID=UPI00331E3081
MRPADDDATRRSLELENQCADAVAHKGYQVHQNPTQEEIAGARRTTGDSGDPKTLPDYLIEGYVFDCYSPTPPASPRAIGSAVLKKVTSSQSQRVVINLHDWRGELKALQQQFDDWPVPDLKELVAVTRDGRIVQIVRRD